MMIGILTPYSLFALGVEPSSILFGGTESKRMPLSRFACLIVPARHNTRKVQKFFLTPSGKRQPAQAADLSGLHDFQEDLKEALGQVSLYNEALGTVSTFYLYDRVRDRDKGVPKRAWE